MAAKPDKNAPPGQGGRFAAIVQALTRKGMPASEAKGTAANMGRKKYGKKKFQAMAAAGKKKHHH